MIKYNTEGKILVKTCVRLNKFNQLELFYYSDKNTITCFTFAGGHNECCIRYMYDCELVDSAKAEAFILAYNGLYAHIEDKYLNIPSKRIYSGEA